MNIDDLTIGEVKQLTSLINLTTKSSSSIKEDHGIKIVIADKGFIYVGFVATDPDWVYITNASNIRYWGTDKGLGQLVNGPLQNTKLDKTGNIKLSRRALIALIEVEEKIWNSKL